MSFKILLVFSNKSLFNRIYTELVLYTNIIVKNKL